MSQDREGAFFFRLLGHRPLIPGMAVVDASLQGWWLPLG